MSWRIWRRQKQLTTRSKEYTKHLTGCWKTICWSDHKIDQKVSWYMTQKNTMAPNLTLIWWVQIQMLLLPSSVIPKTLSMFQPKLATCTTHHKYPTHLTKWIVQNREEWFWSPRDHWIWWIDQISGTAWSRCDSWTKLRMHLSAWTNFIKCKYKTSKAQKSRNTLCILRNEKRQIWGLIQSITRQTTISQGSHWEKLLLKSKWQMRKQEISLGKCSNTKSEKKSV